MFIDKYEGVTRINLLNGETVLGDESGVTVSSLLSGDWYFAPTVVVETNLGIDDAIASRPIQWGLSISAEEGLFKKILIDSFTISVDNGGTVCIHPVEKGETIGVDTPIWVVAYLPQSGDEQTLEILPVLDLRTGGGDDDGGGDSPK